MKKKKGVKRTKSRSFGAPPRGLEYTDIGHAESNSEVWVYNHSNKIETHPLSDGSHNKIWGPRAMSMWRGRFDPGKRIITIVPPISMAGRMPPQALLDALEHYFGTGFDLWEFNPDKTRPRRIRR